MVVVNIESNNGHDRLELEPQEAMRVIREETEQKGKWLTVNGQIRTFDTMDVEALENASDVTLINRLKGG